MSRISVVVCTFNRCVSLQDTLESLMRQALPSGLTLEIIVVDNNSTDRTAAVVALAAERSPWPLRYVLETTQGLSVARNTGIAAAHGNIVAFTDDDVIPEPSWVRALSKAFIEHHGDCVGGKILPLWLQPPPTWLASAGPSSHLWDILALLDRGSEVRVAGARQWNLLYGANMAFRKSLFDEVGTFRTDLGPRGADCSRGDDTDMLMRLLRTSKRVVYTPHAVVRHKVPPQRLRLSYLRRWQFGSGRSNTRLTTAAPQGIPRWLVRECMTHGLGAMWSYVRQDWEHGLQRELGFWYQLGQLVERAHT